MQETRGHGPRWVGVVVAVAALLVAGVMAVQLGSGELTLLEGVRGLALVAFLATAAARRLVLRGRAAAVAEALSGVFFVVWAVAFVWGVF